MDHFGSICSISTTCGWLFLYIDSDICWFTKNACSDSLVLSSFCLNSLYLIILCLFDIEISKILSLRWPSPVFLYIVIKKNIIISPSYPIVHCITSLLCFGGIFWIGAFRSGICAAWRSGFLDAPDTDGSMVSPRFFQRFPLCLINFNSV